MADAASNGRSGEGRPAADRTARSPEERAADHATISESIDELLPALIAKLGATGLAELEIREDALRVRLRRPPDGTVSHDRRASDRARGHLSSRAAQPATPAHAGPPAAIHVTGLTAVGPGKDGRDPREAHELRTVAMARDAGVADQPRAVATSPAVGIYHPRADARAGTRVRTGDPLGTVDMLGVPQEVVSPVDGVVGASLVESGDAVEYGQDLVVIEFATAGTAAGSGPDQGAG
jgi:biotin carboxyl carrier protein